MIAKLLAAAIVLGVIAWTLRLICASAPTSIWIEAQKYEADKRETSSGERLEFWKKSLEFISQAPVIGHGTGTIRIAVMRSPPWGRLAPPASFLPIRTIRRFAVGIQLGVVGIAVLWAMWIAHLMLFRGGGLAAWVGLVVVVQNIVGSLFNSHLFDFTQGWVYVIGVGVAEGIAMMDRKHEKLQNNPMHSKQ